MLLRGTPVTQVGAAGQGAVEGTGLLQPTGSLCEGKEKGPFHSGEVSLAGFHPSPLCLSQGEP